MSTFLSRRRLVQATGAALAGAALPALAQTSWPSRPIRIIVPYTAGGFTDQMARLLTVGLQKQFGQPVVIDNKPGANSIIGVDAVAKSAPDGHTFGVVIPAFTANTTLYPKLPYNPRKDLMGVSLLGVSPLVAAVAPNAPFKTVKELVAYAKANPGKVSFASSGNGSSDHLSAEVFWQQTGTEGLHIPYKGGAPAINDLLGGQVEFSFQNVNAVLQHIRAGKLHAIAVTGDKRSPVLPDVPTLAEAGVTGAEVYSWQGMAAPKGLPPAIKKKLSDAAIAAINDPAVKKRMLDQGLEIVASTPEAFTAYQAREFARWKTVIETRKITAD